MHKMNRFSLGMLLALVVVCGALSVSVLAGSVYDRKVSTLSLTAGTGTTVNDVDYSTLALKRIWVIGGKAAVNTVTVQRVTSDLVYTQAVAAIVTASGAANTATFTAGYLAPGDFLTYASTIATGATVMVEYEVQRH